MRRYSRPAAAEAAFTLIETLILSVLLIFAALALSSTLFKQKQNQVSNQQSLTGRKVLTEAVSKLQAAPWQYPYFRVKDAKGSKNLTLSYVTCYDRTGSPVATTLGSLNPVATVIAQQGDKFTPSNFKLSQFCQAPASDFEVQVTPQSSASGAWNGAHDVWVVSVLSEEMKLKKGIIRHFFREEVVLEQ